MTGSIIAPPPSPEMDKIIASIPGSVKETQPYGYDKKGREKCRILLLNGESYFVYRAPNCTDIIHEK